MRQSSSSRRVTSGSGLGSERRCVHIAALGPATCPPEAKARAARPNAARPRAARPRAARAAPTDVAASETATKAASAARVEAQPAREAADLEAPGPVNQAIRAAGQPWQSIRCPVMPLE